MSSLFLFLFKKPQYAIYYIPKITTIMKPMTDWFAKKRRFEKSVTI